MSNISCPGCRETISLPPDLNQELVCLLCGAEFEVRAVLVRPGNVFTDEPVAPALSAEPAPSTAPPGPEFAVAEAAGGEMAAGTPAEGAPSTEAPLAHPAGELAGWAPPDEAPAAETAPMAAVLADLDEDEEDEEEDDIVIAPGGEGEMAAETQTGAEEDPYAGNDVSQAAISAMVAEGGSLAETAALSESIASEEPSGEAGAAAAEEIEGETPEAEEHDAALADMMAGAESASAATVARSASRRATRRGPSIWAHLVGVVGGGFIGLILGYYILVLVFGPQYNFLELRLPGLSLPEDVEGDGDGGSEPGIRPFRP
jgi:hypothetical protein